MIKLVVDNLRRLETTNNRMQIKPIVIQPKTNQASRLIKTQRHNRERYKKTVQMAIV